MTEPKKRNILLISPPVYDFATFDLWSKPVGLLSLGKVLREQGHHVRLVDAMDRYHEGLENHTRNKSKKFGTGKYASVEIEKPPILSKIPRTYSRFGIPQTVFEEEIGRSPTPDLILITSMMTYWYPGVFESIRTARRIWPKVPIVLGGIYARLCTSHAIKNSGADYVCTEADPEKIFPVIATALNDNTFNDESQQGDRNEWPIPDFSFYPKIRYGVVTSSLGCPYRCSYCASPALHKEFRQRSPDSVIREILNLRSRHEIKDIAFYDDALLINAEKHLIPILEACHKQYDDFQFHTPNGLHTKMIDEGMASLFRKHGFKTLRLSLETSDCRLQHSTGGKVTNQDYIKAVKALRKAGYKQEELKTYIMAGMPGQELSHVHDTIDFVFENGAWPSICEYSMIPGSADWKAWEKRLGLMELDPLIHNNTIFAASMGWLSLENMEELKVMIREKATDLRKFSEDGTWNSSSLP